MAKVALGLPTIHKPPGLLKQIGRHRLIRPMIYTATAAMMLLATACSAVEAAGPQAHQTAAVSTPTVERAGPVLESRMPNIPPDSFRNLQRRTLQRTAQQSFDYQTVTDMTAPTFADLCAGRARTNPINGTFSVPMTDVMLVGRMYIFDDVPEYANMARDPNSISAINAYLESVADFWRHFYGIQINHRTQSELIPLGNFWNGDQPVYDNEESLANRGLQVAPAPQAERPNQYVVPFDIYMGNMTYPMIGRPLGYHGQVLFHPGPILDGVNPDYMEDAYHEAGHSFGLTHKTDDPNEIMQPRNSAQPFRVSQQSANENCPAQTEPTPTATATPRPPGSHRVYIQVLTDNAKP